jgi:glycosyltransferase involved in cell wall biosynthesis
MFKAKRILIITDIGYNPVKMFLDQMHKLYKGFIRLGHDARIFSYRKALLHKNPLKSKTFARYFFKTKADNLLIEQIRNYKPDIIYVNFARCLDAETIERAREAVPKAVFIGVDADPWPGLHPDKIKTAQKLDILTATNDGEFLGDYREAGVKLCVFMPNMCDPDIDHFYETSPEWKTNMLWTGTAKHSSGAAHTLREELVDKLAQRSDCTVYGCFGKPQIGGINYLYAISGARIGVNVNAYSSVRLCHSDRLTNYLSCGTFVLANRFVDSDILFRDGEHLRYFENVDEFFDLADWYLKNESERKKIADAGMHRVHKLFNCEIIAKCILDLVDKGSYDPPWTD